MLFVPWSETILSALGFHALFVVGSDAVPTEPDPDVVHHGLAARPRQAKALCAEISGANSTRLG